MTTDKQCIDILEDTICQYEAMDKLLSDSIYVEIKGRVKGILHAYVMGYWISEAYQQRQNHDERKCQYFKRTKC